MYTALLVVWVVGAPCAISDPAYPYSVTPPAEHSAAPGNPVIRRVELNKQHFPSHDRIRMKVITSNNVTTVRNHELGHGGMHFTATTAAGETTTATASVTF